MEEQFKSWVELHLMPSLQEANIVSKVVTGLDSMLGNLYGIQLESKSIGGHVYFWDTGTINYNLFSFEKEEDIIEEITITNLPKDVDFIIFFRKFIKHIKHSSIS